MSHRENAKGARNPRIHLLVLKILRRDTFRVRRNAAPLKRLRPRPLRQSCGAFRVRRNAAPLKLGIRRGLLPSLSAQWLGRPPCSHFHLAGPCSPSPCSSSSFQAAGSTVRRSWHRQSFVAGPFRGSTTRNVDPAPSLLSSSMRPPNRQTRRPVMARPSPMPGSVSRQVEAR